MTSTTDAQAPEQANGHEVEGGPTGLLERLEERWGEDRGCAPLWGTRWSPDRPSWSLDRQIHPLLWGLGVELSHETGGPMWAASVQLTVTVGPFSVWLRREWPTRRATVTELHPRGEAI